MKVFWIALMSIAVTFGSLFGQNGQAKLVERYEFDMKEEGENIFNFAVYTLKNKGLIVLWRGRVRANILTPCGSGIETNNKGVLKLKPRP